ncbi:unnamed protein product, partial [Ceratitis capitata]
NLMRVDLVWKYKAHHLLDHAYLVVLMVSVAPLLYAEANGVFHGMYCSYKD